MADIAIAIKCEHTSLHGGDPYLWRVSAAKNTSVKASVWSGVLGMSFKLENAKQICNVLYIINNSYIYM